MLLITDSGFCSMYSSDSALPADSADANDSLFEENLPLFTVRQEIYLPGKRENQTEIFRKKITRSFFL